MRLSIVTLLTLALLSTASFAQGKIGVVSSAELLMTHKGTKAAEEKLRKKMTDLQQQVELKKQDLMRMQEDAQAQAMLLSDEQKMAKAQELEKKYQELQVFAAQKEQEIAQLRAELLKPIQDEVTAIVHKIANDGGYDIVFDETGAIVFVKDNMDLTDQVLKKMKGK